MHTKQIENLLNLNEEERVSYFIRYCSDWEEIWGLSVGDDWIIFKDEDGDEIFPLWPHKELAELCAFSEHKEMGAKPKSISIYTFLDEFLQDEELKDVYYGIFYNKQRQALVLSSNTLKEELEAELDEHE